MTASPLSQGTLIGLTFGVQYGRIMKSHVEGRCAHGPKPMELGTVLSLGLHIEHLYHKWEVRQYCPYDNVQDELFRNIKSKLPLLPRKRPLNELRTFFGESLSRQSGRSFHLLAPRRHVFFV